MTSTAIEVTFEWPEECEEQPLTLTTTEARLKMRDPDDTSLISAKREFASTDTFTMSAIGPTDDEFMSRSLIEFVWSYADNGNLAVSPEVEPSDAERALEYFGFSKCTITIPADDPFFAVKTIAFNAHRKAMAIAPKLIEWVKTEMTVNAGVAGAHFIVDDTRGQSINMQGDALDPLLDLYKPTGKPQGLHIDRFGDEASYADVSAQKVDKLISASDKTASALRDKVCIGVNDLGGLLAEWQNAYLVVSDDGEYGMHNYHREKRWVLKVSLDKERPSLVEHGIRKRPREA